MTRRSWQRMHDDEQLVRQRNQFWSDAELRDKIREYGSRAPGKTYGRGHLVTTLAVLVHKKGCAPDYLSGRTEVHNDHWTGVARDRAGDIRQRICRWVEQGDDLLKEIQAAWEAEDWRALGYGDWKSYVDGEFGDQLKLVDDRREWIPELRRAGMSQRAISDTTGVSQPTVSRDLASDSPDSSESPDAAGTAGTESPGRVKGTDGKRYPAGKQNTPPAEPEATQGDPGQLEGTDTSPAPQDSSGDVQGDEHDCWADPSRWALELSCQHGGRDWAEVILPTHEKECMHLLARHFAENWTDDEWAALSVQCDQARVDLSAGLDAGR